MENKIENNQKNYEKWLNESYEFQEGMGYFNKETGDIISEQDLKTKFDEYVSETNNPKPVVEKEKEEKKEEKKTDSKKKQLEQKPESEALEIIKNHKGKGNVTEFDLDPKKNQKKKKVVLYDKTGKIEKEFYYVTEHKTRPHATR